MHESAGAGASKCKCKAGTARRQVARVLAHASTSCNSQSVSLVPVNNYEYCPGAGGSWHLAGATNGPTGQGLIPVW